MKNKGEDDESTVYYIWHRYTLFRGDVAVGMLTGLFVAYLEVKRKGFDTGKLFDLALYSIISAVVGARLFYIAFYNFSFYLENPVNYPYMVA